MALVATIWAATASAGCPPYLSTENLAPVAARMSAWTALTARLVRALVVAPVWAKVWTTVDVMTAATAARRPPLVFAHRLIPAQQAVATAMVMAVMAAREAARRRTVAVGRRAVLAMARQAVLAARQAARAAAVRRRAVLAVARHARATAVAALRA